MQTECVAVRIESEKNECFHCLFRSHSPISAVPSVNTSWHRLNSSKLATNDNSMMMSTCSTKLIHFRQSINKNTIVHARQKRSNKKVTKMFPGDFSIFSELRNTTQTVICLSKFCYLSHSIYKNLSIFCVALILH